MWRLPGLLGRAIPRSLGPSLWRVTPKSTSPGLPLSEELCTKAISHPEERSIFPCCQRRSEPTVSLMCCLSQGALAVLALQLARQIHFRASLPAGPPRVEHCSWHSPLDRFLSSPLWHPCSSLRQHVLPSPDCPAPRHTGLREPRLGQEEASAQPQNFSHNSLRAARPQDPSEEGPGDFGFLHASGSIESKAKPAQPQPTGEKEQDKSKTLSLEEAVTSFQQIFQLSVSIAFNFLGNQMDPASRQEGGKMESQGHSLAQYRYARCLLRDPASSWNPEQQRAVSMVKQAADSGLREAQAFLGVLFTKEPYLDEKRAVKYLWLAANNGDSQSRYHLGICYEKGLGVQRNLREALRCYRQSAALGNEAAQERLQALFSMEAAAPGPSDLTVTGLKSFSSPSLCSLNTLLAGTSRLPHASSTGNLGLLCRSGHLGASLESSSRAILPPPYPLEGSVVRLGFG
ncbi:PREDICTED: death ligand signal enhancer [Mandrillus leucophaeus]|uniref:death ligand signal enhancer n=1 Tax=Mandrillus leucophaeus TaxID=9568 RepID=UPI0005F3EAF5|nr:PREDICTED: death ligand signal enhancer [Mandrillus leucophaeus]